MKEAPEIERKVKIEENRNFKLLQFWKNLRNIIEIQLKAKTI